jgi:Tfp pilus assembly protein PilF
MPILSEAPPAAAPSPMREFNRPSQGLFSSPRKRTAVLSLLLILATLAVYNSVIHNGFINLDDNGYITNNKHIQSGLTWTTVRWSITTFECENWHPLTWISHAFDWQVFGKNAGGHHYMSVLLHALSAVLLFLLLQSATGFTWRSFIVAALFAIHPVNVESVAWAAERKTILSMVFFLLAMLAYGWYAQRPSIRRYSAVALLFACALMAKPQVITFPCVLLLWDYWPLRRLRSAGDNEAPSRYAAASFRWLVLEKLPLLLLSAGDAVLTLRAQHGAVNTAMAEYSFRTRLGNAVLAYARYIGHAFWPLHLSPVYPFLDDAIPFKKIAIASLFLLLITGLSLASRKRYFLVGWLWFLGTLVPMIGVIQVGNQSMADRYAYVSFIGLFCMVTWGIADAAKEWHISSRWLAVPACLAIGFGALVSARQVTYWRDSETLWRYALSVTDRNFLAHSYLAQVLTKEDKHAEAIAEYSQAKQIHRYPATEIAYFADYELRHDHMAGALADARYVLQSTDERFAREIAFRDLGIANTQLGNTTEARENYSHALQLDPQDPFVLMGLGLLAHREGNYPRAADFFSRAIAVDPTDFHYLVLAKALKECGRQAESSAAYEQAQRVSSDLAKAQEKADWFLSH